MVLVFVAVGFYVYSVKNMNANPPKIVSILTASDLQLSAADGIKNGMEEAGFREGKEVIYEIRNPKGDKELVAKMARDIINSRPDVIVPISTTAAVAIRDANNIAQLPVVFVDVGNLKQLGIVDVKKPGGSMTGLTSNSLAMGGKRVEMLKEAVPWAQNFAVVFNPNSVNYEDIRKVYDDAAKMLGMKITPYNASSEAELKTALDRIAKDQPDGFLTIPDMITSEYATTIVKVLTEAKIPSIDFNTEKGAKEGYLIMLGVTRFSMGKEGARLIIKALKGEKLGDVPIEYAVGPTIEINLKTAEAIGVELPDSVLNKAAVIYK